MSGIMDIHIERRSLMSDCQSALMSGITDARTIHIKEGEKTLPQTWDLGEELRA